MGLVEYMDIGIIGLPRSGKSTLFNAVTKGNVNIATYSNKPNIGVTKVPDDRLQVLAAMYNPKKVIHAEVTYTEVPPPPEGFGKTRGIGGEYLNALQSSDALLIVLRSFDEPSVAHIDETVDARRDLQNMLMELMFSDIGILERRISRIESSFRGLKSQEKDLLVREQHFLEKLKSNLEERECAQNLDSRSKSGSKQKMKLHSLIPNYSLRNCSVNKKEIPEIWERLYILKEMLLNIKR